MQHRRMRALIALPIAGALALAACGSDSKPATTVAPGTTAGSASTAPATTAGSAPATAGTTEGTTAATTGATTGATSGATTAGSGSTGGSAAAVSLKGDCPDTVAIQTDWMPEAEHGFLYQMVGKGYAIDKSKAYVTGPLIDQNGNDTGVKVQVRSGGAAQNFQNVTSLMYSDDALLLGYVYTDEGIQNSARQPTVAIESGFDKNPQMIMWDPATYPDVKTIADLGKTPAKVRYFGGAAYMDYFTNQNIIPKDHTDGSYQGDPSGWLADEGKSAQQGFASAEPYLYENEIKGWMKPVAYAYINDAGWKNYAESIATKPQNIQKYSACFKKLVPIIQHAAVDYLNDPVRSNAIIQDAVATFGTDFGWAYTPGTADYAAKVMRQDKLVANGPDGVMGKFDMQRVNDLIKIATPVYLAQDSPPKEGLKAEDIVTNEFLDPSIGL